MTTSRQSFDAYTSADEAGAWQLKLAREMKAAGIPVDLNKLT